MLHFYRRVPVVVARAPPGDRVLRIARPDVRLPEVRVLNRVALAVGGEIAQIAIGDVVPVGVVPRPIHRIDRCGNRVIGAGNVDGGAPYVSSERSLEGGAP